MNFMIAFKDYIDQLNDLAISLSGNVSVFVVFKTAVIYVVKSVGFLFWYLISFRWFTDFSEIPALVKQNYLAIFSFEDILKKTYEVDMDFGFFTFLEKSQANSNHLGTGFLNSFFVALPFSAPQILTMRALLINGVPAGVFSALGMWASQSIFFACVLFGFEFILMPWLGLEPVTLIIGSVLMINLIYRLLHNPQYKLISVHQRKMLYKFGRTTFVLNWFQQMCIYSYFGNLTVTGSPNLLQTADHHYLLNTIGYFIGLSGGLLFWTVLWGFAVVHLRTLIYENVFLKVSSMQLNIRLNQIILHLLAICTFATIPYYSVDYLAGGSVGFIHEDKATSITRPQPWYTDGRVPTTVKGVSDSEQEEVYNTTGNPCGLHPGRLPCMTQLRFEDYGEEVQRDWANRYNRRTKVTQESMDRKIGEGIFLAPREYPFFKQNDYSDPLATILAQEEEFQEQRDQAEEAEERARAKQKSAKKSKKSAKKEMKIETEEEEPEEDEELTAEERAIRKPFEMLKEAVYRPDIYAPYKDSAHPEFDPRVSVTRLFREKYTSNPVYRAFIRLDMYPFLLGDNPEHRVSVKQEAKLFDNRMILQNYTNSILDYKDKHIFNPKNLFDDELNEKKTYDTDKFAFSNQVYNQQFKGSLSLIRQYNLTKIAEERKWAESKEELEQNGITDVFTPQPDLAVLRYEQLLYNSIPDQNEMTGHEELDTDSIADLEFNKGYSNATHPAPLYIGWDGSRRKFLVKTSTVPNEFLAGDHLYIDEEPKFDDQGQLVTVQRDSLDSVKPRRGFFKRKDDDLNKKDYEKQEKTERATQSKTTLKIPSHYSFQAWSPAVDDPELTSAALNLPFLSANWVDKTNLKAVLGFLEKEDDNPAIVKPDYLTNDEDEERKIPDDALEDIEHLFEHLPHYNWYWKHIDPEYTYQDYLHLGNVVPPQLDGFAWPGIQDPFLKKKFGKLPYYGEYEN